MQESADTVAALDGAGTRRATFRVGLWRREVEASMRALAVVVLDVVAENMVEMASPCDQEPVETLLAHAADEPLGVGVRLWPGSVCG